MSQLMSKEVLYEPLKELNDKVSGSSGFTYMHCSLTTSQYPSYLKDNASKMSAEDHKRYTSQSKVVAQIVAIFESTNDTDEDTQARMKVVELMQEVRPQYR